MDSDNVYWTEPTGGQVRKTPLGATTSVTPIPIADGGTPWDIAVDATRVYWTNGGPNAVTLGSVMSAPK